MIQKCCSYPSKDPWIKTISMYCPWKTVGALSSQGSSFLASSLSCSLGEVLSISFYFHLFGYIPSALPLVLWCYCDNGSGRAGGKDCTCVCMWYSHIFSFAVCQELPIGCSACLYSYLPCTLRFVLLRLAAIAYMLSWQAHVESQEFG